MQKELVRRWYEEMWNRWNEAVFDQILDPEIELRGSLGQAHRGPAGIAAYMRFVRGVFPDFHNQLEEMVEEGDRVFARLRYTATHGGELFGIPASGRRIEYMGAALFDFGHFEAYVRTLNWFVPAALIPAIAWTVTILETGLTVALAPGLWVRRTAIAGGTLLLVFALAMTAALGLKAPLNYSASAGAFLLATVRQHAYALENVWRPPLGEQRVGTPSVQREG